MGGFGIEVGWELCGVWVVVGFFEAGVGEGGGL